MSRTNLQRAENGRDLCALALTGSDEIAPEDYETGLCDTLANLLHFARRNGINFEHELGVARDHHAAESRFGWGEIPQ